MRKQHATPTGSGVTLCIVAALLAAATGAAADDPGAFKPVAPGSKSLSYDIPLQPWLVDAVAALRMEFVDAVSADAAALEEATLPGTGEAVLTEAERVVALAGALRDAVIEIGEGDASFGIPGVSRLPTVEGAIRDTVFGFVMWHESPEDDGVRITGFLEGLLNRIVELRSGVQRVSGDFGELTDEGFHVESARCLDHHHHGGHEEQGETEEPDPLEEPLVALGVQTMEMQRAAKQLEGLIGVIVDGTAQKSDIRASWQAVLGTDAELQKACGELGEAVSAFRAARGAVHALLFAAHGAEESVELMLNGQRDEEGLLHISWEFLDRDVSLVQHLKLYALGDHRDAYPEDMIARLPGYFRQVVVADRVLAERAVEYTSARVGRAEDLLEAHYRGLAEYDTKTSQRDRDEALMRVDVALRGNLELQSALIGARAARAALEMGREYESAGACSENKAIIQYKYAWIHTLNAGASALNAVEPLEEKGE